ncbi:hypothetical protein SAY87_013181 [Trapa incisa]|uniref:Uncharacterized protein n=1 Tax=Trapa incisa TaxID=236973 RepID=A0AAN7QCY6_9MYRT|nr:hypothetical protein SAY87_013181 [Trapa incisa]
MTTLTRLNMASLKADKPAAASAQAPKAATPKSSGPSATRAAPKKTDPKAAQPRKKLNRWAVMVYAVPPGMDHLSAGFKGLPTTSPFVFLSSPAFISFESRLFRGSLGRTAKNRPVLTLAPFGGARPEPEDIIHTRRRRRCLASVLREEKH